MLKQAQHVKAVASASGNVPIDQLELGIPVVANTVVTQSAISGIEYDGANPSDTYVDLLTSEEQRAVDQTAFQKSDRTKVGLYSF